MNTNKRTPIYLTPNAPTPLKFTPKQTRVHRQGGRLQGQGRGRDRGAVGERLLRDARVGEDLRHGQGTFGLMLLDVVGVM